jgi:arylsulfatase A-like enzyme
MISADPSHPTVAARLVALLRICLALAVMAALDGAARAADAPARPNIVYILADDLGWKDVGFHGSDIQTPNLDELAKTGLELQAFYVEPMCTPTRAALMTGRYPMRYGLQTAVIPSGGKYGLAKDEVTLPQMLKDAGYETALVGKWHLGHAETDMWPKQRGFDHAYGPLIGEIDHFTHTSHGVKDWYRNNEAVTEAGYDTQLFGQDAVAVIKAHDTTKPLFLYLAFTAPHTPYQAPEDYLARYPGIADPLRRAYAGQITAMDAEIGKVVAALDSKGMRDNTLILFSSDNGGTRSAMFAGEGKVTGEIPPDNGPYRDGKGSNYEGGTRVVALANWPGHVPSGKIDEMIHVVDVFPTLAGLSGGSTARSKPLDGVDVWPTLSTGASSPRDEIVYNIEPFRAALRKGNWKLVWKSLLPPKVELFDLAADPSEKTNLADSNPQRVQEMQARILELAGQMAPPLFLMELVSLGLSIAPVFPEGDLSVINED